MGLIMCEGCNRETNTALCNWVENARNDNPFARECYAAWIRKERRYVRGCGYDNAPDYVKKHVDKLIEDGPRQ